MKNKPNYEKRQLKEQEETNFILWVNTIATVVASVASLATLILGIMTWIK